MTFYWLLMLYYVRYGAGHTYRALRSLISCVFRPHSHWAIIPRALSRTPTHPTILTIVHSDGTSILSHDNSNLYSNPMKTNCFIYDSMTEHSGSFHDLGEALAFSILEVDMLYTKLFCDSDRCLVPKLNKWTMPRLKNGPWAWSIQHYPFEREFWELRSFAKGRLDHSIFRCSTCWKFRDL
jgi:hypothetical protein